MEDLEIRTDVRNKISDKEAVNEKLKLAQNWLSYEIESAENKAEILEEEVNFNFICEIILKNWFQIVKNAKANAIQLSELKQKIAVLDGMITASKANYG